MYIHIVLTVWTNSVYRQCVCTMYLLFECYEHESGWSNFREEKVDVRFHRSEDPPTEQEDGTCCEAYRAYDAHTHHPPVVCKNQNQNELKGKD